MHDIDDIATSAEFDAVRKLNPELFKLVDIFNDSLEQILSATVPKGLRACKTPTQNLVFLTGISHALSLHLSQVNLIIFNGDALGARAAADAGVQQALEKIGLDLKSILEKKLDG